MDDARLDALRPLGADVAAEVAQVQACRSPLTRAQALGNLALSLLDAGAAEEALECARASHELAARPMVLGIPGRLIGAFTDPGRASRGRDGLAATALHIEGVALNDLHRPQEAIEPLRFAYRWFSSRDEHARARDAAASLCSALESVGREDEAAALLDEALDRAEQQGDVDEAEHWRAVRARRAAWRVEDPDVMEADYIAAYRRGSWSDAALLALRLGEVLVDRGDDEGARAYAEKSVEIYAGLPSPSMRPPEARARWWAAWLAPDSDDEKASALVEAEAALRRHGDVEGADHCRSHVVATLVRTQGWGAAAAWAAAHPDGEGSRPPPDAAVLVELWEPNTSEDRARDLLRGASEEDTRPELLQALALVELRWGDLERGLALLDRALALPGSDPGVVFGMQHDRALGLLTRGREDEGRDVLASLLAEADATGRRDDAGGLAHELACWLGRGGDLPGARRHYERAVVSHRATEAELGRSTACATRDAELNLAALDGAELPEGFAPFRSGGFAMSWCDGTSGSACS